MLAGSSVALQFELKDSCHTDRVSQQQKKPKKILHAEAQSSPNDMERKRAERKVKCTTVLLQHLPYFVYKAGLVQVT